MGKKWRGYRLLVVADRRFRWQCVFNHPLEMFSVGYSQNGHQWAPDTLRIRSEERPNCLLTVCWPPCQGPVVTPGLVRLCVDEAVRRGWPDSQAITEIEGTEVPTSVVEGGK